MKKLLTLLLITPFIFAACGDDDKEEEKPYFNPVEGKWVYTSPMKNTETRIFTKQFEAFVILDNSGDITNNTLGIYTINETSIHYNMGIHDYTIIKDTLTLRTTSTGYTKKFVKENK